MSSVDRHEFLRCLALCAQHPELLTEFDRLTGSNLSQRGSLLDLEIDRATGRMDADFERFVEFVREFIWGTFKGSHE